MRAVEADGPIGSWGALWDFFKASEDFSFLLNLCVEFFDERVSAS